MRVSSLGVALGVVAVLFSGCSSGDEPQSSCEQLSQKVLGCFRDYCGDRSCAFCGCAKSGRMHNPATDQCGDGFSAGTDSAQCKTLLDGFTCSTWSSLASLSCVLKGPCQSDIDCDDDDSCTSDVCGAGECKHADTDADGDGFTAKMCGGRDCNDELASAFPGAAEACNGKDDDCDGKPDNGLGCVLGSAAISCKTSCGSDGKQVCGTDCSFGACVPPAETCNGYDEDCDGKIDNGFECGIGTTGPCESACGSAGTHTCAPGCKWGNECVPPLEACNGKDDDCDGVTDEPPAVDPKSPVAPAPADSLDIVTLGERGADGYAVLLHDKFGGDPTTLTLLSSKGEVTSPQVTLDLQANVYGAALAASPDGYAVAYWDGLTTDSYVAFVSKAGAVQNKQQLNLGSTADMARIPDVAFTGNEYVAVWDAWDSDESALYFSRFDTQGAPVGAAVKVLDGVDNYYAEPQLVVGDGELGMIYRVGSKELYFSRVSLTGALLGTPLLLDNDWEPSEYRIQRAGDAYAIAWFTTNGTSTSKVRYARVLADGTLSGSIKTLAENGSQYSVRLAASADQVIVAWLDSDETFTPAKLSVIAPDGTLLTEDALLWRDPGLLIDLAPNPDGFAAFATADLGLYFGVSAVCAP